MSGNDHIKERTDYVLHETSWLFQRFNYFLVGIAFLVTALAAIVSSQHFALNVGSGYLAWFGRALCAAGYSLSFFFAVVNHLASIEIQRLRKTLDEEPETPLFKWANKTWPEGLLNGRRLFNDIHAILNPSHEKGQQIGSHTYLVPLGFWLFWLLLSLILLPSPSVGYWWSYLFTIGYLVAIPVLMYWLAYFFRPRRQMHHNGNLQKSEGEAT